MRRRSRDESIRLEMTPMIDVVFQLLTFFLMTYNVAPPEGDFNLKVPVSTAGEIAPVEAPRIVVRLTADSGGNLAAIRLGEVAVVSLEELHRRVLQIVRIATPTAGMGAWVAELDCDARLKYAHTLDVVTALTGRRDASGAITRLVDGVRFAPSR